ncbi:YdcH family protein [Bowmanella sp. JS7-9]|uniref:YdcH family protein n=1 Tax=Pseudobowmanella zhangzhouensis TaxID=1537679 RepID=A0ABW1XIS4_9ALTE|nr:DUF465 domain-containing protein [Bowmanella sp. JS7-9]TBX26046.1 hypothetical protein TK45_02270 [Bowmanella sp. JS7-9]
MSIEKHDLLHEFPDHHHTIRHLKMNDKHFARLFDQYNALDAEVRRAELGVEHLSDADLDSKKMDRVHLKDELWQLIQSTEAAL